MSYIKLSLEYRSGEDGCDDPLLTGRFRRALTYALLVSLADKLYNTRTILLDQQAEGERVWDRFTAPPEDTIEYYRELAEIYRERIPGPVADEFHRTVQRIRKRRRRARGFD